MSPIRSEKALCRHCGRCCTVKLELNGEAVLTPFECPHLDLKTRLCTIYARRYELNPYCTPPGEGIQLGIWPADCPYCQDYPGYVGPRQATMEELELYAEVCLAARQEILEIGRSLQAAARSGPPQQR